jgi:hypothetical protein
MEPLVADAALVAYCGLYCGACGAFRRGRCPGCHENQKAGWCKVRTCCLENGYGSCAECTLVADPHDCKKFNNIISKLFAWIFRSDRYACIRQIREKGLPGHAEWMAERGLQTIKH